MKELQKDAFTVKESDPRWKSRTKESDKHVGTSKAKLSKRIIIDDDNVSLN